MPYFDPKADADRELIRGEQGSGFLCWRWHKEPVDSLDGELPFFLREYQFQVKLREGQRDWVEIIKFHGAEWWIAPSYVIAKRLAQELLSDFAQALEWRLS